MPAYTHDIKNHSHSLLIDINSISVVQRNGDDVRLSEAEAVLNAIPGNLWRAYCQAPQQMADGKAPCAR